MNADWVNPCFVGTLHLSALAGRTTSGSIGSGCGGYSSIAATIDVSFYRNAIECNPLVCDYGRFDVDLYLIAPDGSRYLLGPVSTDEYWVGVVDARFTVNLSAEARSGQWRITAHERSGDPDRTAGQEIARIFANVTL